MSAALELFNEGDVSVTIEPVTFGGVDSFRVRIRRGGFYVTLGPEHVCGVGDSLRVAWDRILAGAGGKPQPSDRGIASSAPDRKLSNGSLADRLREQLGPERDVDGTTDEVRAALLRGRR